MVDRAMGVESSLPVEVAGERSTTITSPILHAPRDVPAVPCRQDDDNQARVRFDRLWFFSTWAPPAGAAAWLKRIILMTCSR
jgi:hypothetical protein